MDKRTQINTNTAITLIVMVTFLAVLFISTSEHKIVILQIPRSRALVHNFHQTKADTGEVPLYCHHPHWSGSAARNNGLLSPEGDPRKGDTIFLIRGIHRKIKHFISFPLLLVFCFFCIIASVIITACGNIQLCDLHIFHYLCISFYGALHLRKGRVIHSVMPLHTHGTDSGSFPGSPSQAFTASRSFMMLLLFTALHSL